MKKIFFTVFILAVSAQANAQAKTGDKTQDKNLPPKLTQKELAEMKAGNIKKAAAVQFQYFITKAAGNTYGYSIYANGNLYIQQTTIPGLKGANGFTDTTTAAKTAVLVIKKIKNGEMPPAVTLADLKKIGIE